LLEKASRQLEVLKEGIVDLISEPEFLKKLEWSVENKKPLRIKYGADPSAPDLHLGHTVPLRKLRQFQEFGHTIIFIIGDFTARIGDPTQRSETRRMLTREEVNRNAVSYQEQVFRILDSKRTETVYNSKWLGAMTPEDFLSLTAKYTVARMLERDDFQNRYRSGKPIALVEFLYPLLQGHDSVQISSDVEIGGTDQMFNLLVGRDLQREAGQAPQVVMTLPLIEGTDGVHKMSKSMGNAIALEDEPENMFGKVMSIPDRLMGNYYRYVSGLTYEESDRIIADLKADKIHPREAKSSLAAQIVRIYHGNENAERAREHFDQVFKDKGLPEDIEIFPYPEKSADIVSILKETGLVSSKGEGRRLIQQGGVKLSQEKISDMNLILDLTSPVTIQCGKRKFLKVQYRGAIG